MIDYLFICQGNIARSQIAEGFYNNLNSDKLGYSCGIDDVGYKYNYKCYLPAIELMNIKGIDLSKQIPKQISSNIVNNSSKIIVLCNEEECDNKFPDYLLNHNSVSYIKIGDPNKKSESFLSNTISKIQKIVKDL